MDLEKKLNAGFFELGVLKDRAFPGLGHVKKWFWDSDNNEEFIGPFETEDAARANFKELTSDYDL